MSTERRTVELGEAEVVYLEAGPADAERIWVLLHGAAFTKETWIELGLVEALVGTGDRVVAIDLPGARGESPPTHVAPAAFLAQFLDAVGIERAIVVSPSMSGRYAIPFLVEHPGRLRGFVAVAPIAVDVFVDQLEDSPVPVLGMWGENDQLVSVAVGRTLADTVARGRLHVIENAAHACYLDAPEEFVATLLGWAADLP